MASRRSESSRKESPNPALKHYQEIFLARWFEWVLGTQVALWAVGIVMMPRLARAPGIAVLMLALAVRAEWEMWRPDGTPSQSRSTQGNCASLGVKTEKLCEVENGLASLFALHFQGTLAGVAP